MNFKLTKLAAALGGAAVLALAGCGGGSSGGDLEVGDGNSGGGGAGGSAPSTTLSGTVAGGAAVVGNVIVTDSKGATKSAAIETTGRYSIDVSGMTGPFLLKAAGTVGNTSVTYYSAATTADVGGTVNVTPFTDLIVSNIAAQLAENYFNTKGNLDNIGTLITPAALAAAETALQAKLQPVLTAMGLGTSVDLLRQSFNADHSGLDAVLDLVKVSTDKDVTTFTNALTQVAIGTDDLKDKADQTVIDDKQIAGINPATATDLQTVVAKLNAFAALFATGLPTPEKLANSGLFDTSSSFMMSGQPFDEFATEISTEQSAIGMKLSNVDIALDESGKSGMLTANLSSKAGGLNEVVQIKMVKDATKGWLVQGDGRIADVSVEARAQLNYWEQVGGQSGSNLSNGISMYVDPFSYNSNHLSAQVVQAVVTGPGLPSGGIKMTQNPYTRSLDVEGSHSGNLIPECNTSINGFQAGTQCVNVDLALDNSRYTVVLKDANGTSLNDKGYQLTLRKQPDRLSNITNAMFPAITSVTVGGQALDPSLFVPNASITVNWTVPTGLVVDDLNVWAENYSGESYFRVEKENPATTQAIFALGATPMSNGPAAAAGVWIRGVDVYGRTYATSKYVYRPFYGTGTTTVN